MEILYYLMLLLFYGYVITVSLIYGLQPSVSETVYRLPKSLRWIFTLVTWGYAFCAMIIGLELTGNGLVFLAGAGIIFVGAAPLFHKEADGSGRSTLEGIVHTVGATVGITAMGAFLIAMGVWYLPVAGIILTAISYLLDKGRETLWGEIIVMTALVAFYEMNLNFLFN